MYPHRIRLRDPWDAEPLDPHGETRRVVMPARFGECGLGEYRKVRFSRRFGRPRQIDGHERVWLVGEGLEGQAEISLNARHLVAHCGCDGPFEIPVSDLLTERNELAIEIEVGEPGGGLWGDVALEIRCRAYLKNMQLESAGDGNRLRVTGDVAGDADGPLEVYALADGMTIGYRMCSAGDRVELLIDDLPQAPSRIRVELVNGAVIWFAEEILIR
jgi:hypothetical protein